MKRKSIWIICSMAALMICLPVCSNLKKTSKPTAKQMYIDSAQTRPISAGTKALESGLPERIKAPEVGPYVSPVDFEALWAVNEDVYAWMEIPGTEISYPLLQRPEDDAYYIRRNMEGEDDLNGVIYTESGYNGKDFFDPLTLVYGHNMKSGKMFGSLQEIYSSKASLEEHSKIVVYLPDRELHYDVFAAVPFDSRHILYNYDFTDRRTFRLFFQELLSIRALNAVYAKDAAIQSTDKAVILSTCLSGNRSGRFLVCGKLSMTIPAEINQ